MMIWYDLTPGLLREFAVASRRRPAERPTGPAVAVYVAPSEECRVLIYPMYMWRRKWGMALATAQEAGFQVREVTKPSEAAGCKALLVLGDGLAPAEEQVVRAFGLPVVLTPQADAARARLPEAASLPADREAQIAAWRQRANATLWMPAATASGRASGSGVPPWTGTGR